MRGLGFYDGFTSEMFLTNFPKSFMSWNVELIVRHEDYKYYFNFLTDLMYNNSPITIKVLIGLMYNNSQNLKNYKYYFKIKINTSQKINIEFFHKYCNKTFHINENKNKTLNHSSKK